MNYAWQTWQFQFVSLVEKKTPLQEILKGELLVGGAIWDWLMGYMCILLPMLNFISQGLFEPPLVKNNTARYFVFPFGTSKQAFRVAEPFRSFTQTLEQSKSLPKLRPWRQRQWRKRAAPLNLVKAGWS